ncbi:response regulator [Nitrosopumilus sp.]|uniref:response regulator n=1 Tax=Nitrosopumilus sp. TaxID=2024843 RepID=UPI00260CE07B|nr:response regulator [Nitrosopumilus sp.]
MVNCIVVDDDQDLVEIFCELLEILQVPVLGTGNNGQDAVNLYTQHKPEIIFTDLNMPEFDGLYAIEKIKEMNLNAKIIAVTGNYDVSHAYLFDALNVGVVHKPFDVQKLKQAITDASLQKELTYSPTLKIQYRFRNDSMLYSCLMTFDQYKNFKELPTILECTVVSNADSEISSDEMQEALDKALDDDIGPVKDLSNVVS